LDRLELTLQTGELSSLRIIAADEERHWPKHDDGCSGGHYVSRALPILNARKLGSSL